jgi:hypothetical protein
LLDALRPPPFYIGGSLMTGPFPSVFFPYQRMERFCYLSVRTLSRFSGASSFGNFPMDSDILDFTYDHCQFKEEAIARIGPMSIHT